MEDVFFRVRSDGYRLSWSHHRSSFVNQLNIVLPSSPIIEVANRFTAAEFNLLTRGPKYIVPCQSRFSRKPMEDIIQVEYNRIVECFTVGLNNHCLSAKDDRAQRFFAEIEQIVRRLYLAPLSSRLYRRAKQEHRQIGRAHV